MKNKCEIEIEQSKRVMFNCKLLVVTSISQSNSVQNRSGMNSVWNYLKCSSWANAHYTQVSNDTLANTITFLRLSAFKRNAVSFLLSNDISFYTRWHYSQKNRTSLDSNWEMSLDRPLFTLIRCSVCMCHFEFSFMSRILDLPKKP